MPVCERCQNEKAAARVTVGDKKQLWCKSCVQGAVAKNPSLAPVAGSHVKSPRSSTDAASRSPRINAPIKSPRSELDVDRTPSGRRHTTATANPAGSTFNSKLCERCMERKATKKVVMTDGSKVKVCDSCVASFGQKTPPAGGARPSLNVPGGSGGRPPVRRSANAQMNLAQSVSPRTSSTTSPAAAVATTNRSPRSSPQPPPPDDDDSSDDLTPSQAQEVPVGAVKSPRVVTGAPSLAVPARSAVARRPTAPPATSGPPQRRLCSVCRTARATKKVTLPGRAETQLACDACIPHIRRAELVRQWGERSEQERRDWWQSDAVDQPSRVILRECFPDIDDDYGARKPKQESVPPFGGVGSQAQLQRPSATAPAHQQHQEHRQPPASTAKSGASPRAANMYDQIPARRTAAAAQAAASRAAADDSSDEGGVTIADSSSDEEDEPRAPTIDPSLVAAAKRLQKRQSSRRTRGGGGGGGGASGPRAQFSPMGAPPPKSSSSSSPGSTGEPPLPPGWTATRSKKTGKVFYVHIDTKQTSWTRPVAGGGAGRGAGPGRVRGRGRGAMARGGRGAAAMRGRPPGGGAVASSPPPPRPETPQLCDACCRPRDTKMVSADGKERQLCEPCAQNWNEHVRTTLTKKDGAAAAAALASQPQSKRTTELSSSSSSSNDDEDVPPPPPLDSTASDRMSAVRPPPAPADSDEDSLNEYGGLLDADDDDEPPPPPPPLSDPDISLPPASAAANLPPPPGTADLPPPPPPPAVPPSDDEEETEGYDEDDDEEPPPPPGLDNAESSDDDEKSKLALEAREARAALAAREAQEARDAEAARAKLEQEAEEARAALAARQAQEAEEARRAQAAKEEMEALAARQAEEAQRAREALEARQAEEARLALEAQEAQRAREEAEAAQRAREEFEAQKAQEAAEAKAALDRQLEQERREAEQLRLEKEREQELRVEAEDRLRRQQEAQKSEMARERARLAASEAILMAEKERALEELKREKEAMRLEMERVKEETRQARLEAERARVEAEERQAAAARLLEEQRVARETQEREQREADARRQAERERAAEEARELAAEQARLHEETRLASEQVQAQANAEAERIRAAATERAIAAARAEAKSEALEEHRAEQKILLDSNSERLTGAAAPLPPSEPAGDSESGKVQQALALHNQGRKDQVKALLKTMSKASRDTFRTAVKQSRASSKGSGIKGKTPRKGSAAADSSFAAFSKEAQARRSAQPPDADDEQPLPALPDDELSEDADDPLCPAACADLVAFSRRTQTTSVECVMRLSVPPGGEEQFQAFLDAAVTPRFPSGLTVDQVRPGHALEAPDSDQETAEPRAPASSSAPTVLRLYLVGLSRDAGLMGEVASDFVRAFPRNPMPRAKCTSVFFVPRQRALLLSELAMQRAALPKGTPLTMEAHLFASLGKNLPQQEVDQALRKCFNAAHWNQRSLRVRQCYGQRFVEKTGKIKKIARAAVIVVRCEGTPEAVERLVLAQEQLQLLWSISAIMCLVTLQPPPYQALADSVSDAVIDSLNQSNSSASLSRTNSNAASLRDSSGGSGRMSTSRQSKREKKEKSSSKEEEPLDRFELSKCLGRGSSGTVWAGKDKHSGELVAIKRLPLLTAAVAAECAAEIALMKKLDSPYIVKYLGNLETDMGEADLAAMQGDRKKKKKKKKRGEDDKRELWIVLELCPRGTVARALDFAPSRRFSLPSIASVAKGIALGLHYLHSLNIVHRDIKPEALACLNGTGVWATTVISSGKSGRAMSI